MLNVLNGHGHLSVWTKSFIFLREIFKKCTNCKGNDAEHDTMAMVCRHKSKIDSDARVKIIASLTNDMQYCI
jgi:hypothetical protein